MNQYLFLILITLTPIFELRGSIPLAILEYGMNPVPAYILAVGVNALVPVFVYIFLATFHKLFMKWTWYEKLFTRFIEKSRHKLHDKVEKYGFLGITLFVAIPLPITGAYTGTVGAWILGVGKRKTIFAVFLGVMIAGLIVTAISLLIQGAMGDSSEHLSGFLEFLRRLFIKELH
jgi:uncharacterized membrane protein